MDIASIKALCARGVAGMLAYFPDSSREPVVLDENTFQYPLSGEMLFSSVTLHFGKGDEFLYGDCPICRQRQTQELCIHVAGSLYALRDPALRQALVQKRASAMANALLNAYEPAELREQCLRLEVELQIDEGLLRLGLRVGRTRLYVVKDMEQFVEDYFCRRVIAFGKNTSIDPAAQAFPEQDERVLRFIRGLLRARRLHYEDTYRKYDPKMLALTQEQLRALLDRLTNTALSVHRKGHALAQQGVCMDAVPFMLGFSLAGESLQMDIKLPPELEPATEDGRYVLIDRRVYRLSDAQKQVLRPLLRFNGVNKCRFTPEEGRRLLSEQLPLFREAGQVRLDEALESRIEMGQLLTRIWLDAAQGEVLARVGFIYGEESIDPFVKETIEKGGRIVVRDVHAERAVLELLEQFGFLVRPGEAHLSGAKECYRFLSEGVAALGQVAEVYTTKALLGLKPRRARAGGRMSLGLGGLEFYLSVEGVTQEDAQAVLEALRQKRQYVRLKDGQFLTLAAEDGWGELAQLLEESDAIEDGVAHFQTARAAYLPQMAEQIGIHTEQSDALTALIRALQNPVTAISPVEGLRPYQERGLSWLKGLADARLGGVLADDMGLGKTVQVLALILLARKEKRRRRPCLVIAPTSLVYNWQAEVEHFTPELSCVVLSGGRDARQKTCASLEGVDVVVASYAQLRRDIEWMEGIAFRYVILDEAQQIKNAASAGAEAARRLTAHARFALTGTPMENHLGELWSIFDFILPGYLGAQSSFMARFAQGGEQEALLGKLRPFLLRRVKKDVLAELPDKTEEKMVCRLAPEQRRVYDAALMDARRMMDEADERGGLQKEGFRMLAALTRLRQICCHPALCYEGYQGSSGKLELLMELMGSLLDGGHRILLFSQFTSMLALVRRRLAEQDIEYLYLDGGTPAKDRLALADRFNAGEAPVFVISLKAGGFGLNLTGADTVIHYDPWWNPAVEEQATDRAHRIGQSRHVTVYRLIARDTIEEKVAALQERKRELIDAVIRPGDALPEGMSAKEIRALFS